MVALNFDARSVEPAAGFDPVPAGWYKVMADESGPMKPAKNNPQNAYLPIRFAIVEGQYKNKKLFVRLNIVNANQQAQEIAYKELSAIGHATGVLVITTSEELHNKPLWVKVKVRKGGVNEQTGDTYEDSNEIQSYKDITFVPPNTGNSAPAAGAVVVPPVATAPQTSAPFVPPALPAAAPAPVAPPVAAPTFEMAPGEQFTREQYLETGWTDETLIAHNKMRIVPAAAPAPAPAPVAPAAPPGPPAAAGTMPWADKPTQPWTAPAPTGPASAPAPTPAPMPPAAVAAQGSNPPWSTAPKA